MYSIDGRIFPVLAELQTLRPELQRECRVGI
jgi:hypothetical protein